MLIVPERLAVACRGTPERRTWLEMLPHAIRGLQDRWSLSLGTPFESRDGSCAWVAPAVRRDGTRAILKLGMPHMEATHELQGLRFWDGNATVRLLESDADLNAMLLEPCEPGTALRELPELEQDVVVAGLLRRLWRKPAAPHPFRPLSAMTTHWADETRAAVARWPGDAGLIREGLRLLAELPRSSSDDVLLTTDLHAGNVLRAQREPWLAIDPKPLVGEREFGVAPIVRSFELGHSREEVRGRLDRLSSDLGLDRQRARLWSMAQTVAWSIGSEYLPRHIETAQWLLEM